MSVVIVCVCVHVCVCTDDENEMASENAISTLGKLLEFHRYAQRACLSVAWRCLVACALGVRCFLFSMSRFVVLLCLLFVFAVTV